MVKIGERYRHYKSTGGDDHTYEVIHIGMFQGKEAYEDELMVVYKALYPTDSWLPPEADVVVRPLREWFTEEERNGQKVVRFTKIS